MTWRLNTGCIMHATHYSQLGCAVGERISKVKRSHRHQDNATSFQCACQWLRCDVLIVAWVCKVAHCCIKRYSFHTDEGQMSAITWPRKRKQYFIFQFFPHSFMLYVSKRLELCNHQCVFMHNSADVSASFSLKKKKKKKFQITLKKQLWNIEFCIQIQVNGEAFIQSINISKLNWTAHAHE